MIHIKERRHIKMLKQKATITCDICFESDEEEKEFLNRDMSDKIQSFLRAGSDYDISDFKLEGTTISYSATNEDMEVIEDEVYHAFTEESLYDDLEKALKGAGIPSFDDLDFNADLTDEETLIRMARAERPAIPVAQNCTLEAELSLYARYGSMSGAESLTKAEVEKFVRDYFDEHTIYGDYITDVTVRYLPPDNEKASLTVTIANTDVEVWEDIDSPDDEPFFRTSGLFEESDLRQAFNEALAYSPMDSYDITIIEADGENDVISMYEENGCRMGREYEDPAL